MAALPLAAAGTLVACVLALLGLRQGAMVLWCRLASFCVGVRVLRRGWRPPDGCLVASNHVGYLDPLALGGLVPGGFLAKQEIAGWPGIALLVRLSGGVFIDRDRPRSVAPFIDMVARRLLAGDRVLVFPEGRVSPDGRALGRFHPMIFEAALRAERPVVPAAIRYTNPADPTVWAWIGEPSLWRHLWNRLFPAGIVDAEVWFGEPLWPAAGESRKELAQRVRGEVERLLRKDDDR